jgi:hypothetical protein
VGYGLVEWLEVIESGFRQVRRAVPEVFVEPPVRLSPRLGTFLAKLLGEVLTNERMGVKYATSGFIRRWQDDSYLPARSRWIVLLCSRH